MATAPPPGSYATDFVNTWQKRLSQAQAAGLDTSKFRPIIQADWRRVRNGSSPYSDTQAGIMSNAALHGKPLIDYSGEEDNVDNPFDFALSALKNAPGDIGQIAAGLNPITLFPALADQVGSVIENPGQLAKPLGKLASGDVTGALKSASRTPILNLIPGVYTAKNVLTGDWEEIAKHPVMTGLDLLPYAGKVGKLAMTGKAVEGSAEAAALAEAGKLRGVVEPQSPSAALLEGKPLKAAFRAAGGTTDSPLSLRWFKAQQEAKAATANVKPLMYGGLADAPNGARLVPNEAGYAYLENPPLPQNFKGKGSGGKFLDDMTQRADKANMPIQTHVTSESALNMYKKRGFEVIGQDTNGYLLRRAPQETKLPTVYRTSDTTAKIAEALGFDKETRELNRLHNILRRVEGHAGRATWEDYKSWFEGLDDEEKGVILRAAQRFKPDALNAQMGAKFTPEMRDIIEQQIRPHMDELAEPYIYDPWEEASQREAHRESGSKDEFAPEGTAVREDKRFIAIPNEGGQIDVYPVNGDVGRAYQKVFEKQRKMEPLQRALDDAQAKMDAEVEAGLPENTPEAIRRHERADVKFKAAKKELEKAQTFFDKIHNRAAPARFGELLKDQFKGRLSSKVRSLTDDNVSVVFRRSNDALERSVQNPQGAFFGFNLDDFEYNRTNLMNPGGEPAAVFGSKIRPKNALTVDANGFETIGGATLRHYGHGDVIDNFRSDVANDMSATWNEAFDNAEKKLGIKISPEDRAALAETGDTSLAIDAIASEYARKNGHDAIVRRINEAGPNAEPAWRPYEVTVLKKDALLAAQKEPVLTAEQAARAADAITNNNFHYLVEEGIVTQGELHAIMDDVMNNWQELARQGYDPVYVPFVPEYKQKYLLDQKPLAGNLYTPRQFLSKDTLSFAPQSQDMAVAMTSYAKEIMKQHSSLEMFKAVRSMAVTEKMLVERYGLERARQIISQHYIPYSDTAGRYLSKPEMALIPDGDKLLIPRVLNKNLDRMMNTFERDGLFGAYDKGMKAYKFAVLTGPRHVAHVLFGGLAMMMGEHGVTAFPKFYEALKMVRNGEIPTTLSRGLDYFTPEELATIGQGKTMGRLLVKALGSPFRAIKNFEEHIADTQRVMTYLREIDKGVKAGLDTTAAEAAAMKLTNKVYMDIDGMAPIERTVLRHVFPFYAFTKHIIRYALNYPADHPWRAATLANIIRIEQQDHESGLPSQFNDFLFLGDLDKDGNQTAIDVKNFNPFRSLEGQNPLTLAGFLSALTPAITLPATVAGLNTLTATPDLYPDLDYDPRTGKLVARHPDAMQQALQVALPPSGAIQGILGLSESWRSLKKSDPDAYNRALMSAMNLPFIPQNRNLNIEKGKAEMNRYRAAQGALHSAMRSGDTGELGKYSVVPFQGNLVKSSTMIQLIEAIKKKYPGISPASVIPRSHGENSLGAALAAK